MAIISVQVMNERRGQARADRKGSLYEVLNRHYTKKYKVITDNAADGPKTILAWGFGGIPKVGESYLLFNDVDLLATCTDVEVEEDKSHPGNVWTLTAQYDTDRLISAVIDNPLLQPAEIRWQFTKAEIPMRRDATGTPIKNSASEAFIDPLMRIKIKPLLSVTRNEIWFDPGTAVAYQEVTNLDTFANLPAYYCKLNSITGDKRVDAGATYWAVTYEVEIDYETFAAFVLDQGYKDIKGNLFRDPIDYAPLSYPTLLNGRGKSIKEATGTLAVGVDASETVLQMPIGGPLVFPPLTPIPPHWYFEVRIDSEVMQVRKITGDNFTVVRGWSGTTAASHATDAVITLDPYYLRFLPFRVVPFGPLKIPVV